MCVVVAALVEGEHAVLLILLSEEHDPADRIARDRVGLDREVEKSLEAGQFPVDRSGPQGASGTSTPLCAPCAL